MFLSVGPHTQNPASRSTATVPAALRATRMRNPQKLVLAIPVAPTETLIEMRQEADDVVCLEAHERMGAIG